MSAYKGRRPVEPHVLVAEVVTTKRMSQNLVRVTLGGPGIGQLTLGGHDQWFRLFLPRPGQDAMRLPTRTSSLGWYAQYLVTPRSQRPWVRSYTIRGSRPDLHEIDVDFVVHGADDEPHGPGTTFAETARPGDSVGILDQGIGYNPRHEHDWTLLVADESGLPAVAGVCESLADDARGIAVVEVPTADDKQDFRVPDGIELLWVERDRADPAAVPGAAALAVVREARFPAGAVYAFAVGESGLATGVRRHLVNDRGVPKAHVDFVGYWRHGRAAQS
ncbi:siderophore-interacting protein [Isoptericola halotolerans]|uniref:NADPH-dependent ferric siderophore reductase n=1 Tax=Isoptericola halotolerans TaxID=300560 RepID=A0ABX2A841_9MICO|nr:siderophore-interacting protein [Isoptericola halotolerans]NOV98963.1 NADPH-dependent ferric siderophore reductase [Isoptericola halotolerans]